MLHVAPQLCNPTRGGATLKLITALFKHWGDYPALRSRVGPLRSQATTSAARKVRGGDVTSPESEVTRPEPGAEVRKA